ncbi:hypothetical protein FRB90_012345 [Tulasnella sp. 427]|nr:hypothetical protein FRB90_012345 [Tulasnella sp. 427]
MTVTDGDAIHHLHGALGTTGIQRNRDRETTTTHRDATTVEIVIEGTTEDMEKAAEIEVTTATADVLVLPDETRAQVLQMPTNTVKASDGTATVLKYNEPPEARKPTQNWRLYVFKGKEDLGLLHIAKQSCYLVGRDHLVADIPIDHPSCSKQHAAIQFRQVQEKDEWGAAKAVVKPFVIDLESTNGTFVNDTPIPVSRYYELKPSDVIKFGQSTRELVEASEFVKKWVYPLVKVPVEMAARSFNLIQADFGLEPVEEYRQEMLANAQAANWLLETASTLDDQLIVAQNICCIDPTDQWAFQGSGAFEDAYDDAILSLVALQISLRIGNQAASMAVRVGQNLRELASQAYLGFDLERNLGDALPAISNKACAPAGGLISRHQMQTAGIYAAFLGRIRLLAQKGTLSPPLEESLQSSLPQLFTMFRTLTQYNIEFIRLSMVAFESLRSSGPVVYPRGFD